MGKTFWAPIAASVCMRTLLPLGLLALLFGAGCQSSNEGPSKTRSSSTGEPVRGTSVPSRDVVLARGPEECPQEHPLYGPFFDVQSQTCVTLTYQHAIDPFRRDTLKFFSDIHRLSKENDELIRNSEIQVAFRDTRGISASTFRTIVAELDGADITDVTLNIPVRQYDFAEFGGLAAGGSEPGPTKAYVSMMDAVRQSILERFPNRSRDEVDDINRAFREESFLVNEVVLTDVRPSTLERLWREYPDTIARIAVPRSVFPWGAADLDALRVAVPPAPLEP